MDHWANSPFIVPVAVFAMVLGIVIVNSISMYHTRRLQSEERLAAIAKGLPIPEPSPESIPVVDQHRRARGLRTGGIVCVSVGIGLALFGFALTWIVGDHDVLAVSASGIIPLAVGIGLIVDYAFQKRDLAQQAQ
jgi:hydrogenase-4 membrane subunit HyfE